MLIRKFEGPPPVLRLPKGSVDTQVHMYLPNFPAQSGGPRLPPDPLPGPEAYRKVMEWLGVEHPIITQGNAHQCDNSNLIACLGYMGEVARGMAVISGKTDDVEMLRLSEAGVVGARIADLPGGAVSLASLEAIDARAKVFNWCIAVQFDGMHILDHEARLSALKSPWILDHHGKFLAGVKPDSPQVDAVKRLIDGGRCWFKFAGCYESSRTGGPEYEDIAQVARVISAYAPDRIVWGTNWPHNARQRTEEYPDDGALLDTVSSWFANDADRHRAMVENPRSLFGFPKQEHLGAKPTN